MQEDPKTSAAAYLTLTDEALIQQCVVDRYRGSGPGGQKRNKTSSAVRLRHQPTGLTALAEEERSQHVNLRRAVRRLRESIALELRHEVDVQTYRPSDLLRAHLVPQGGPSVNRRNEHYYPIVSEVLDVLAACRMRVSEAAELIGLSTAGLVKYLESDPKVWAYVNRMRTAAGCQPLKRRTRSAASR